MNEDTPRPPHRPRRKWLAVGVVCVVLLAVGGWRLVGKAPEAARNGPVPVVVVTAPAAMRDVPVRLSANGTVTALKSVDLRSQITSTVKEVRIREGQNVRAGEPLFTLDAGTEEANLRKAHAQVEKDQSDFATAERNLKRQVELFNRKFISQAALDTARNQVDTLTGQLAIDRAAVQAAQVALTYTEIRAPFAGRTGIINVRAGSLVAPTSNANTASAPPLVTVTQIDPISVAFTLPERELPGLQQALAAGPVIVSASPPGGSESFQGRVVFVDNAVDTTTGTIRVKAEFDNPKAKLWPGMFVMVQVSPRTLFGATVVPAQAVQTGPDSRFVYVVGADGKAAKRDVKLAYIEQGFAVVDGVSPGARVVVEGAQNLRPGSLVAEAQRRG
jgi:RND family efflux transporter MFP subunit